MKPRTTSITPISVWFGESPKSSNFYTSTDFSLFARWLRSRLVLRFFPKAYLIGKRIDRSGIITPKEIPTHKEVLERENDAWFSAKT